MDTCVGSLECSAVVAAVPAHDHLPPSGEAHLQQILKLIIYNMLEQAGFMFEYQCIFLAKR
jgi:hypothetical protein